MEVRVSHLSTIWTAATRSVSSVWTTIYRWFIPMTRSTAATVSLFIMWCRSARIYKWLSRCKRRCNTRLSKKIWKLWRMKKSCNNLCRTSKRSLLFAINIRLSKFSFLTKTIMILDVWSAFKRKISIRIRLTLFRKTILLRILKK